MSSPDQKPSPERVTSQEAALAWGGNAFVSRLDAADKIRYPGADLLRVEIGRDPTWARRYFLQMQAAQLVAPENFPKVIAAEMDPPLTQTWEEIEEYITRFPVIKKESNHFRGWIPVPGQTFPTPDQIMPGRTYRMYTEEIAVNADHHTLSKHMIDLNREGLQRSKFHSRCDCDRCVRHRSIHESGNFKSTIKAVESDLSKYKGPGDNLEALLLPTDDESDYCINEAGKAVFFEVDFYPKSMLSYLKSRPELSPAEQKLRAITEEYQRLVDLASAINARHLGASKS